MGESQDWRLEATVTPQPAVPKRIGQYELIEPVGAGGMGVVWKGLHVHLGQTVAIKFLAPNSLADPQAISRFYGEMKAVGRVSHQHIVRALDAGQYDGHHVLVMEFVEGISVRRLLNKKNPIPVPVACEIVRQAALGLSAIHAAGMIHRDIKPSNLFLSSEGVVKVLDLGLARGSIDRIDGELTLTGNVVGTIDYMSPEQAENSRSVDARADLYSLGCTLYALLSGAPPFDGPSQSLESRLRAHREVLPRNLQEIRSDIPWALSDLVCRLLEKSREKRVPNADQLAIQILPFATGADLAAWKSLVEPNALDPKPVDSDQSSRAMLSADIETSVPNRVPVSTRIASIAILSPVGPANDRLNSRNRRKVWVAVTAAALSISLILGAVALRRREQTASSESGPLTVNRPVVHEPTPGIKLRDVSAGQPQAWQKLLDVAPVPILWKSRNGLASWTFEEPQEQLFVTNDELGLLGLGTTSLQDFSLRVGIHQNRWKKGAGVFVGFRDSDPQNSRAPWSCLVFQIDEIRQIRPPSTNYQISAAEIEVVVGKDGRREVSPPVAFAFQRVARPVGEMTLEIVVSSGRLSRLRLDGTPLEQLISKIQSHPQPLVWTGGFGVFVESGSSTIRNCQFMNLKSEP